MFNKEMLGKDLIRNCWKLKTKIDEKLKQIKSSTVRLNLCKANN